MTRRVAASRRASVRAVTTSSALPKQYDPSEVEPRWLRFWLENGFFHADEASPTVPYSITLPPPNVTGSLHIGHALGSTMQDILIRWKRMQGFNAMWMPGIDHASIAVHVLLEKDLKRRENKTRFELGRDEFMKPRVGVEGAQRQPDQRAGEADGLLARLAARALHDGREVQPRGDARRSSACTRRA